MESSERFDFSFLNSFESLGINCEFGFVQRRCGVEPGHLLRWAFTPLDSLRQAIAADFCELYQFKNLLPSGSDMVWDEKYHISFHTKMKSTIQGGGFQFSEAEKERREIWEAEHKKILYLREKFLKSAKVGGNIYVLKLDSKQSVPDILSIWGKIRSLGSNSLLCVREALVCEEIGTIKTVDLGLHLGNIDRFAPNSKADDLSIGIWLKLCQLAWEVSYTDRK
ncbi:MAG: hypothetical protein PW843_26865 [Azospirillaceae bacterium]|nr:hypothetical protein [Azospirillaceae bacterium]